MRVLVAGVGNVLGGDDGFGPAVAEGLREMSLPPGVRVIDAGIAGFALVRELLDGYDALVIVDAIDRGLPPGTVKVLEPVVPEVAAVPDALRASAAGDMHRAVPGTALLIARAAGALPPLVRIVGCQPETVEMGVLALSERVRRAIPVAIATVQALIGRARDAAQKPPEG